MNLTSGQSIEREEREGGQLMSNNCTREDWGGAEDGGSSEFSPGEEGEVTEEGTDHAGPFGEEVDREKERPLQRSGLISCPISLNLFFLSLFFFTPIYNLCSSAIFNPSFTALCCHQHA